MYTAGTAVSFTTRLGHHVTRHEKKVEHRRVSDRLKRVSDGVKDLTSYLRSLNDSYVESKQYLPNQRYRLMKYMIEEVTDGDKIAYIRVRIQEAAGDKVENREEDREEARGEANGDILRRGVHSLTETAHQVAEAAAVKASKKSSKKSKKKDTEKRPLVTGGTPYNKAKQILRKGQKLAGFDPEPVEDEDVMTDAELDKGISQKSEQITVHVRTLDTGLHALLRLKEEYRLSEQYQDCLCPLYRYYKLKAMIKEVVRETRAMSSYEDEPPLMEDVANCFGR